MSYLISAESPMDLDFSYITNRGVIFFNYKYLVNDLEFDENMNYSDDYSIFEEFEKGNKVKQVQCSEKRYEEYFDNLLQNYDNVVHITFGSGLKNMQIIRDARNKVIEKYQDKRLEIIETPCFSSGYGLLIEYACDYKDSGLKIDDFIKKVNKLKNRIEHVFFSTDPNYIKRTGKVTKKSSRLSKLFGVVPIFRLDENGKLVKFENGIKTKKTIDRIINYFKEVAKDNDNYEGKCFICHSDCVELAKDLKDQVLINFPMIGDVKIWKIGPTIASYTGLGTVAIFFLK